MHYHGHRVAVHDPGPLAYLVLFLWIPISAVMFAQNKPRRAAFLVMIWGTLTLPELVAVDPPILPGIDKHIMASACAFVGLLATAKGRARKARLLRGMQLFFFIMVIGNIGTAMTNPESFVYGGKLAWEGGPRYPIVVIPPLPKTDFINASIYDFFKFLMPVAVGQMMVQSREDAIVFLKSFAFAALCYVPPMLFEGAMSPQLHRWTYGYHALDFAHNIRGGGFKPTVYMQSGLGVAMFVFVGVMSAIALIRVRKAVSPSISAKMAGLAIFVAMALSRNVAVMFYTIAAAPLALMTRARTMGRVGMVLAVIFVTFPITRAKDWFPAEAIIEYTASKSVQRADSLAMRFDNEMMLLEHTLNKPWFGWGSYGRNRRYDPESGQDISVTDGEWAIHYSVRGAFGVTAWFWLLALPVLWGWRLIPRVREQDDQNILGVMTLAAAINAADLLPNSSFTQFPFVWAGALTGFCQHLARRAKGQKS